MLEQILVIMSELMDKLDGINDSGSDLDTDNSSMDILEETPEKNEETANSEDERVQHVFFT